MHYREYKWKVHLFKGYLSICHPEERHPVQVDKLVDIASSLCIREWRKLPSIVSHIHLPYLQAAQQASNLQRIL